MIDTDAFTFEQSPWEQVFRWLKPGDTFSAAQLLTLTEEESEQTLEEIFADIREKGIILDMQTLPHSWGNAQETVRLRREQELVAKGRLMEDLEEADPLRLYLQELTQTPVEADLTLLVQRVPQEESDRQKLLQLSLPRVAELAMEQVGRGVLLLDLMQEAALALWEGLLSWQGQGDFFRYRDFVIINSLQKSILLQARQAGVGQHLQKALADYREVDEALLVELGRNPTVEEIAQKLHISSEEGATLAGMLEVINNYQRTRPQAEEEIQEQEEDNLAVEDTAYFQTRQRVEQLLTELTPQEAKLLSLRFGLEGGLPLDSVKTGQKLGMTPEEVVDMEAAALKKLRK